MIWVIVKGWAFMLQVFLTRYELIFNMFSVSSIGGESLYRSGFCTFSNSLHREASYSFS